MSKSKSKQEEALQLLDDLDSFTPLPDDTVPTSSGTGSIGPTSTNEGEAEVLAFIDEITQKSSEPLRPTSAHHERPSSRSTTPSLRKPTERVKLGGLGLSSGKSTPPPSAAPETKIPSTSHLDSSTSWGWGSVWTSASAAIQQARTAVDEQVKQLPHNEQAKKWKEGMMEYAKHAQLDKIGEDFKRVGLSTLTDILNVVAPPISEHEVILVWLSHDMQGFEGTELLVYRSLTRVMEQVEGGDLIVKKGSESRPKDASHVRDIRPVEGYESAVKLAQAELDELIKTKNAHKPREPASDESPATYSYVFIRVQPFFITTDVPKIPNLEPDAEMSHAQQLQFLFYLVDPSHKLSCSTLTQVIPGKWLELWDDYDWVEDLVAEAMRVGAEVVGQEYIVARMGWKGKAKKEGETNLSDSLESSETPSEKTEGS